MQCRIWGKSNFSETNLFSKKLGWIDTVILSWVWEDNIKKPFESNRLLTEWWGYVKISANLIHCTFQNPDKAYLCCPAKYTLFYNARHILRNHILLDRHFDIDFSCLLNARNGAKQYSVILFFIHATKCYWTGACRKLLGNGNSAEYVLDKDNN